MNAAALVDDLRRQGVHLAADGDQLRFRGPKAVLTNNVLDRMRAEKPRLLDELRSRRGPCPADRLNTDWRQALARAREGFAHHGTTAARYDLEAAAFAEVQHADPTWWRQGLSRTDLRALLDSIYSGRLAARITDDGRVVVWSAAGRPS